MSIRAVQGLPTGEEPTGGRPGSKPFGPELRPLRTVDNPLQGGPWIVRDQRTDERRQQQRHTRAAAADLTRLGDPGLKVAAASRHRLPRHA
ncbi:hypothetical protein [Streptomyces fructofermentans]|uniref:hypothetical protein n=1 Tax=Streptomyces fructofermentans TaxID=152141 RepID=UPI0033E08C3D